MRIRFEIIVLWMALSFASLTAVFILTPGLALVGYSFAVLALHCTLYEAFVLEESAGERAARIISPALWIIAAVALLIINTAQTGWVSTVWQVVVGYMGATGVMGFIALAAEWKIESMKRKAEARVEAADREARLAQQNLMDDLAKFLEETE